MQEVPLRDAIPFGDDGVRPRVLFLACHLPFPPISGGRRRELELLKRLGPHVDVELVVASKTFDEDLSNARIVRDLVSDVQIFQADDSGAPSTIPAQVARHGSADLTNYVAERLSRGDIDLVHVEGFYLMQHVPDPPGTPVLLVEQNVEYVLWRQRTETAGHPDTKRAHLTEYLLTLEGETKAWRRADFCAALTEDDRRMMLDAAADLDVRLVPDGVDHVSALPGRTDGALPEAAGPVLVFVGNFAYQPNQDAAVYLCDVILPRIRNHRPDVSLWLVGNAPPEEITARAGNGVVVTGRVPDVAPYIDAADLVVCPLRIGGGIKVKILEALYRGKAVVTTSVGVQGLGAHVADVVVVRDHPARFAAAVVHLLNRPRKIEELKRKTKTFAVGLPTWDDAATSLLDLYAELLASRSLVEREVSSVANPSSRV